MEEVATTDPRPHVEHDRIYIHSKEWDDFGFQIVGETVTEIDTERRARLKDPL